MHLLGWNVPRSPDPVGLSRDPSKAGRYVDGMWMGARVGTGRIGRKNATVAGRQAGRQLRCRRRGI